MTVWTLLIKLLMVLSLSSFNGNGLRDRERRQQALLVCDADVICLQETHWDDMCVRETGRGWMGEMYVNNGGDKSRGVAILVKRGVIENVRKCVDDGEGRMIGISFEHNGGKYKLINLYAPNEERERKGFFERAGEMCEDNCMIVGDFNVWCGRLDASSSVCYRSDASRGALKKMMRDRGMMDVWRERNPKGRAFSRRQVVRGVLKQSRIDLVLGAKGIADRIGEIAYKVTALSDHMVLEFSLTQPIERRGGGVWCLNGELVKDAQYKKKVREWINTRKNDSMYEDDVGGWWENLKSEIKELSVNYSRGRNRRARKRERELKEELEKEAERMDEEGSDMENYIRIKDELKEIEQRKCKGAIVRSRARHVIEGEKCTRFFLGLEKTKQKRNYLEKVEGKEGEGITDLVGIAERVEGFYRELFSGGEVDEESMSLVLEKVEGKLSDDDREMCEGNIGTGEIEAAIAGLGRNKSPGIDGITGEFYMEFREELVPVLDRVFRWIEEGDRMTADMATGLVSIIHKKGNRDRLENYRPLTMLNTDYKILARVLANRIKRVIGTVVGSTQAYSIPGRDIADTVSSIRDTIEFMKRGKGGAVMSLDLNKAFDRVDHTYLHRVLEEMGFGHRLRGWIRRMYDRAHSCVKINGIVTDTFRLERSVRQGCPMSALLYSLSAEPLAQLLRQNKKIRGIELPGGKESLLYQYADDTTVTVKDRESIVGVLDSLALYGRASGAKVNIEKSEIMYIGEGSIGRVEIGLKEKQDYFRVLGVNLGIKDKEGRDMQYEGIVNNIRKTLGFWKQRGLGLKGKVVVVNTLVMSKLVYVMNVLDVPERVMKEVEREVSEFLWDGKGVRIAREVMENEYEDGGLKLINLEKKKKALRVKMMVRYLRNNSDQIWKVFLKEAIDRCGGCGDSAVYMELKKGMMSEVSDFHKEMLGAWGEFVKYVKYECKNLKQVWEQPVFLNPKITWDGETLYNRLMWRAGFRKVRDLVYEYVPGFMRAQVIVDEVRSRGDEMWMGTAEGLMDKIKGGMPKEWMEMIGRENGVDEEGEIELHIEDSEKMVNLMNAKTRVLYKCLRGRDVRRPAAEKVWSRVMKDMEVKRIWTNLRVKWNSSECENFDFLLRHNRVFNNLIISKFDVNVKKECDVCGVEVETCMHEFAECAELQVYFERLKGIINRCWKERYVERMEWKELWLFGVGGKMKGVSLLNYMLSHARFAVKMRRNLAHYEKRRADVWSMFKSGLQRDVNMMHGALEKNDFESWFIAGSTLIRIRGDGEVRIDCG